MNGNSTESLAFNEKRLELQGESDLMEKTDLAFTSESCNFYEIKEEVFGVTGIFIKVPKKDSLKNDYNDEEDSLSKAHNTLL